MPYKQINYHHLHYFYVVAREGGVSRAAARLNVTAQTVSGQIGVMEDYLGVVLFNRVGKRLELSEMGKLAYSYAEDIFGLGAELANALQSNSHSEEIVFAVGIIDVIPKIFAFDLLKKVFLLDFPVRLVSREGDFDMLLAELALRRLDLVISDRPLPSGSAIKAYSHYLGESGFTFFAAKKLVKAAKMNFPASLNGLPFLLPGEKSMQRNNIRSWFDSVNIHPHIVAEFDDTALLKFFGQSGQGLFCAPSTIEVFVLEQFKVEVVGRVKSIKERYYAISPERKIKHPVVERLIKEAKSSMAL